MLLTWTEETDGSHDSKGFPSLSFYRGDLWVEPHKVSRCSTQTGLALSQPQLICHRPFPYPKNTGAASPSVGLSWGLWETKQRPYPILYRNTPVRQPEMSQT